ncbi:MAG: ABC transporter ATP-binding protein [Clostridiales bacterium]|nr:ABC transporter ATP-binding protein [Clostridiales bacterium]
MLEIKNLYVNYGGIKALKGINMEIPDGKIITLVGANGAGKSTTLKSIMHLVNPASGEVIYNGENITKLSTQAITQKGIVLVPEGRHVFAELTVRENLKIGAYLRNDKEGIKKDINMCQELFPILKERKNQLAGTLSGGEQQMLAFARALMTRPKVLMMDEPSLGLAPLVIKDIFNKVQEINKEQKITILLIEQNANAALKIADYGYVMEVGTIGLEGTGTELLANQRVKDLYLGKSS